MATDSVGRAYLTLVPKMENGWKSKMNTELGSGMAPAGKKAGGAAGKSTGLAFASALKGAIGVVAASEVVGAVVNLGKEAVSAYADYQQLVGGVEKLYGDASQTVMENAKKAFKSVGMSANQYMETATQFSSALVSSLGGDTQEAANRTQLAMQAISDNVNVFGSDMGSVSDAFRGFAKDNYAMLDNLKLGYGGTKSEAERLIKDASKMKDAQKELGVTVDDGNLSFDNMVNAIAVVQQSMGIMGTTSNEAASTVSGSLGMMSSAWDNLLTGLGDPDADVGELTDQFIEAFGIAMDNLLPTIGTVALHLVDALGHAIETGLNNLLGGIGDWIGQFAGAAMDAASEFAGNISDGLASIPGRIKAFINGAIKNVMNFKNRFTDAGKNIIKGLVNGIGNAKQWVIDKIHELCSNAEKAIKSFFGIHSPSRLMMKYGNYIAQGLGLGIAGGAKHAVNAMRGMADDVAGAAAMSMPSMALVAGSNTVNGGRAHGGNTYVIEGKRIREGEEAAQMFASLLATTKRTRRANGYGY